MQNNDCSWWAGGMDWSEKCLGVCIKFTTVESLIVWSCEVLLSVTFYRQLKFNLSPHLVSYLGKLSPKALRTWASAKIFPFWIHWRVQVPHDVPFSKNVTCNLSFFFFFCPQTLVTDERPPPYAAYMQTSNPPPWGVSLDVTPGGLVDIWVYAVMGHNLFWKFL